MRYRALAVAAVLVGLGLPRADAGVLFSNGFNPDTYEGIWNQAGVGIRKANVSVSGPDFGTLGFGFNDLEGGHYLADNFSVAAGETWTVAEIRFYGYSQFATSFPFASATVSLTGANVEGPVLRSAANVPVSEGPGGIIARRVNSTDLTNDDRRIYEISVALATPWTIGPGDYWLRWAYESPSGRQFHVPVVPSLGGGNARFVSVRTGLSREVNEQRSGWTVEFPFQLVSASNATAVPEPSTIASVAIGLALPIGVALRRRRSASR